MSTLRDVIDHHAKVRPDAPFLIAPETDATITYRDLQATCRALGAFLESRGVGVGEVVSFMLPNGIAAATIFLGSMYAGRVACPLNLIAQDALLAHVLAHSDARIVFAAEHVDRIERLVVGGPAIPVCATDPDVPGFEATADALPPISHESPALLMYTSGTTGVPKGALLSHANLIQAAEAVVAGLCLTSEDRVLS